MARVYLSSTYSDLISHRKDAYETLRKMNYDVIAMEDYIATDERPLERCLSDVEACELYIGIFAWRYGYIPDHKDNPDHKSITELEYDCAVAAGKFRLIFILHEASLWSVQDMDQHTGEGERGALIKALRQKLAQGAIVSYFQTSDKLVNLINLAVRNWEQKRNRLIIQPDYFNRRATLQPFSNIPCFDASCNDQDLNLDKIAAFLERDAVKRQLDFLPAAPMQDQLTRFGLLRDTYPTYALLLCFGIDPQKWLVGASIRCIYWRGNIRGTHDDKWNDDKDYSGDLLIQFASCMDFLRKCLRFSRIISSQGSTEQYEIPLRVLQEAVANALVHREYAIHKGGEEYASRTDYIQVEVFTNRVEVKSPGSLPLPMTLDNLRTQDTSHPRNPLLARVFYLYGLVERVGSGIQRMDDAMSGAGLPLPRFEQSDTQVFKVILERPGHVPDEILESEEFGYQLNLGLEGIATKKEVTIEQAIVDMNLETKNSSLVQKWRQGWVPLPDTVAQLARQCVQQGGMDRTWLQAFLRSARYPDSELLIVELFSMRESQQSLEAIIVNTLRAELPSFTYYGHTDRVYDVAWSPDNKYIASASADQTVQVWEVPTGKISLTYRGHLKRVNSVAWSPDGSHIASASNDKTIHVWNVMTGDRILTCSGHSDWINSIAWSHDGTYIASASNDKSVRIWSAVDGQPILMCRGHSHWVHAVTWSSDDRSIASASSDKTVRIWSLENGTCLLTYLGHSKGVNALLWLPQNTAIASAGNDKSVQLWNPLTCERMITYRYHTGPVLSLSRSPYGRHIASSAGNAVHVWNANTGEDIFTDHHHSGWVRVVAWSPDGKYLASGGDNKIVQIRRLSNDENS